MLMHMEWASYIPGLTAIIEASLETRAGALILENREWLFEGIGVTVTLGILAAFSAVMRVISGICWSICCFCGNGLGAVFSSRSAGRTGKTRISEQIEPSGGSPDEGDVDREKVSPIIRPNPDDISFITGMSPEFNPYYRSPATAQSQSYEYHAPAGSLPGSGPYFSWPRYFGTLAKLFLVAALINAIWVGYLAIR